MVSAVRLMYVLKTLVAIEVLDFNTFKSGVVRTITMSVPSADCVCPPVSWKPSAVMLLSYIVIPVTSRLDD